MKLLVAIAAAFLCVFHAKAADASGDALIEAILKNDVAGLKAQLDAGANPNAKGERDTTPLMYAAAYGSLDAMRLLIKAKADVNARNTFDETALLWSASDLDKVRLVLSQGANVNAASKQGRTALLIAAAHDGSEEIVKLLMKNGADPKAMDRVQNTTLVLAALADNFPVFKMMLERGVDVNARNRARGQSPLMAAAGLNNLEAVRLLLAKGADVNLFTPPTAP
jgi:ankyrin repeat protein